MLAQARMIMLKIILPVNHLVKKVYIDSIISTEPLEYNDGWGNLKFEYYSENIEIKNNRREIILSEKNKIMTPWFLFTINIW